MHVTTVNELSCDVLKKMFKHLKCIIKRHGHIINGAYGLRTIKIKQFYMIEVTVLVELKRHKTV